MSETLTTANLNERIYDELRMRVLTRQEPAGRKLSLHVLAAELGVSRSPVHHALTPGPTVHAFSRVGASR